MRAIALFDNEEVGSDSAQASQRAPISCFAFAQPAALYEQDAHGLLQHNSAGEMPRCILLVCVATCRARAAR